MKDESEKHGWFAQIDRLVAEQQEIARSRGLIDTPSTETAKLPVVERHAATMPTTITPNMPTVYGFPGEVQMAKELVKAAHGLNIHELRLIRYAVSTIHPTAQQPPQLFIKIPAIAYADAMEVRESKHFYKDLEKAAEGLWKKQIRIRRDTSKGEVIETIGWLSYSKYHRGEGWIELRFTAEVTPLLSMLNDGGKIIYKLQNLIDLKSVYAARLYELLMQWQDTKRLLIKLDDFRHTLEVPEKYLFGDIKVNCLDRPIKELKEKGKLDVEYTVIKDKDNKRKVGSLEFRWKPVEQIEMPLEGGETPKKTRKKA